MRTPFTVMLIEDNPGDARLLREMLKQQDCRHVTLVHVEGIEAAEKHWAV